MLWSWPCRHIPSLSHSRITCPKWFLKRFPKCLPRTNINSNILRIKFIIDCLLHFSVFIFCTDSRMTQVQLGNKGNVNFVSWKIWLNFNWIVSLSYGICKWVYTKCIIWHFSSVILKTLLVFSAISETK